MEKRLFRNTKNKMLGGICSGIADYMDIDPTIVRLAFVGLSLLSVGTLLGAYIIGWIIIPEKKE